MLFVYNRRKGKIWFRMEYAVFAISFVLPLVLHYFSQYVLDQFDRIMIQKMVGLSAAGVYGVAYNAGMLLKILTSSIRNALIPWQYDRLEKRKFRELDDVLFLVFLLVAVCMLLFTAFAPELMMILADEAYLEATYVIPPVTMGLFFCFMYTVIANVEFFYDQTKYTIFVSMSGAVLNIVLNYFGIKYFGYIAAAYTTLFCYIYFAVVHYIYMSICVRKAIGVRRVFDFRRISLLSAGFLVIGIAMILLYNHSIFRYTVIVAACVLLYLNRKRFTETISQVRSVKRGKRESEPVTDEPDAAEAYRETEETPGAPE